MYYENIRKAKFIIRKNRFLCQIEINGRVSFCHVRNTGRLRELLVEGTEVYVEEHDNTERKTKFSLIAVKKGNEIVNIDSTAPNKLFYEWVEKGCFIDNVTLIRPETTFGNSRFDCYIEAENRRIFVEIKGVTLEKDGIALFPDAPTDRGVKHLNELCECVKKGYEAYIVFVVQMKGVHTFSPNRQTHPQFADALEMCQRCGVKILCVDCEVSPDTLEISKRIDVKL